MANKSYKCNLTEIGMDNMWDSLNKYISVYTKYQGGTLIRERPLDLLYDWIEMLREHGIRDAEFNIMDDGYDQMVAILDQINLLEGECRYCGLPYSFGESMWKSLDHDDGSVSMDEWADDPKYYCIFCIEFEYYASCPYLFIFYGKDHYPRNYDLEGWRVKIDPYLGEDHGAILTYYDKEHGFAYIIRNLYKILNIKDYGELKELTKGGLIAKL